jgi:predicted cupin superfamily sugar epimerase
MLETSDKKMFAGLELRAMISEIYYLMMQNRFSFYPLVL